VTVEEVGDWGWGGRRRPLFRDKLLPLYRGQVHNQLGWSSFPEDHENL
jgi:hypothetical protein